MNTRKDVMRHFRFFLMIALLALTAIFVGSTTRVADLVHRQFYALLDIILGNHSPMSVVNDPILAQVGNEVIRKSDFLTYLQTLPRESRRSQSARQWLDGIIQKRTALAVARKAGIQRSPEYQNRLKSFEELELPALYLKMLRMENSVTRSDALIYYKTHPDEFRMGLVHMSVLLTGSLQECQIAMDLLGKREKFEEVARKFSIDHVSAARGGHLPPIPAAQLEPAVLALVRTLSVGQTGGPVPTARGYELIRKDSAIEGAPMPFNTVEKKILNLLQDQLTFKRFQDEKSMISVHINTALLNSAILPAK
jgi:peptidyl-prolyl cis-trans isomerase C